METPNRPGYRVSLRDVLSRSTVDTLEGIAKGAKSKAKADALPRKPNNNRPRDRGDIEVEVKNDKGNPLPVILPADTFKFSEKLSAKIDKVGALFGQPIQFDDKKLFSDLGSVKNNLELIQAALVANKDALTKAGKGDASAQLLEQFESLIKKLLQAIDTKDKNAANDLATQAVKASEDAETISKGVEGMKISVIKAIEAGNEVINSSYSSLQSQKLAAESIYSILRSEGYKNEDLLTNLAEVITSGNKESIRLAVQAVMQDKEAYSALETISKQSQKSLDQIRDLNTEMMIHLEEQTIQQMLSDKYKKSAAFKQTDTGKGALSLLSGALGIPGAELMLGPLMDVANLVGGKNIMKGAKGIGGLLGKGGKGLGNILGAGGKLAGISTAGAMGMGELVKGKGLLGGAKALMGGAKGLGVTGMAKMGGKLLSRGVGAGILSAGFTGVDEYGKYQDAKAAGASEEELGKIKTKGISKTVGSGVGGVAGAALGSLLGPLGTMAGGYLGSLAGEWAGEKVGDFVNDGGISKLVDTVTGFFVRVKDTIVSMFGKAYDFVSSGISSMVEGVTGFFTNIKDSIATMFAEDGIFGAMQGFLTTLFELTPIGMIVKNFDTITKGFDSLFGDEGIFGTTQKYIDKILDSAPVRALISAFSDSDTINIKGNKANPTLTAPMTGTVPQRVRPEVTKREMDTTSSKLDKQELEDSRKSRKHTQTQIISQAAPAPQSNQSSGAVMNNTPQIDDYGLAFMNSAVFD